MQTVNPRPCATPDSKFCYLKEASTTTINLANLHPLQRFGATGHSISAFWLGIWTLSTSGFVKAYPPAAPRQAMPMMDDVKHLQ